MQSENLQKFMRRVRYLIDKLNRLREMLNLAETIHEQANIDDTKQEMKQADEEYQLLTQKIQNIIKGRYVYSLDPTPIVYVIREYRSFSNELILKRLFDDNQILLEDNQGLNLNLVSANESSFFQKFSLYSLQEENEVKREALSTKEHVFSVKYQLMAFDGENLECLPLEINPRGLPVNDYDIKFSKEQSKITSVVHKQQGAVKFSSFRVDEECGYVRGSTVKIFTAEQSDSILNIVHVHVNDTSEEVVLEVDYMEDEQTIEDFKEFKAD